jgi:hypothetical protein
MNETNAGGSAEVLFSTTKSEKKYSRFLTWFSWGTFYCRVALVAGRASAYGSVSLGVTFSCCGTGISELAWVQAE